MGYAHMERKGAGWAPTAFQSWEVMQRSTKDLVKEMEQGHLGDVGVRPEESGFWKLATEVFQEGRMKGRKKQLFPNVADSLPLNLQSGDS